MCCLCADRESIILKWVYGKTVCTHSEYFLCCFCADEETAILKWVYGKIVNTQSEDFLGRQRELCGGRERDTVVLDLYEDLAYGWRALQVCVYLCVCPCSKC
jgi:hypothetical protein